MLNDDWEYLGYFWLPSSDKRVAGKLKYCSSKGLSLELLDSLLKVNHPFNPSPFSIIHGELKVKENKFITLYDSYQLKHTKHYQTTALINEYSFFSSSAIRSDSQHFTKNDSFESSKIIFTHLSQWIGHNVFETIKEDRKESILEELIIKYKKPNSHCILDLEKEKIHIESGLKGNSNKYSYSLQQKSLINFQYLEGKNLKDIKDSQYRACIFFSLLINSPITVESINLVHKNCESNTLYLKRQFHPSKYETQLSHTEVGLQYSEVFNFLPAIYKNFLELYKNPSLASVLANYCTVVYSNKDYFLEDTFKATYSAIEGLAKVLSGSNTNWFNKIKTFYITIQVLVNEGVDDKFFKRCKEIRDILTHIKHEKEDYPNPYELLDLQFTLKLILELMLLKQIGLPEDLYKSYAERMLKKFY